ncbi:MAG: hypothetical protein KDL87_08445 [Verrucomicrobiae bacterium]|nr:hypothetical protein [Verrucomicrobiae bacterium]
MFAAKHPSVLNDWQIFRQAKMVASHTSRASNPDWYKEATEVDRQWHIWVDGMDVVSAVFDRISGQWYAGPEPVLPRDTGASVGTQKAIPKDVVKSLHDSLNDAQLEAIFATFEEDGLRKLHETLSRLISGKEMGGKAKSLGIILHMADEISICDLAPEYSSDEDFDSVRELLAVDPHEALGDQTADTVGNTWKLLPYWGVKEGERRSVAVQVTRRFQSLFFELDRYSQSHNVPIVASAYVAPLEALSLTPWLIDPEDSSHDGDIIVFQYRRFSTLAVLNEEGELVQFRSLQHRMGQDFPSSLGEILTNTAASVGLANPSVTIAAMSLVNQDGLAADLSAFFADRTPMSIGLVVPSEIACFAALAAGRPEMAVGDKALLKPEEAPKDLIQSDTFENLWKGWSTQNVYEISEEEKEIYPTQKDLKLVKWLALARLVLIAAFLGAASWTGFEYIRTATTEAWKLPVNEAGIATVELGKLKQDKSRYEYWENLMARRSEGWLAMEMLLQLFKPDSGLVVTTSNYSVEGKIDRSASTDKTGRKLGFVRKWTIKGFAKTEGGASLAKLSSNAFLQQQFDRLSKEFKASSLVSNEATRTLDVTMQQRQGQMAPSKRFPMSVARHYRNSFEVTITQTFGDKDELAITMVPPSEENATTEGAAVASSTSAP